MNDRSDESRYRALGLKLLVSSGGSSVVIVEKLWKEFAKLPREDQRKLVRWMGHWCDGEHQLPPEKFKILGKFGNFRIDEFKSYQSRAYGVAATILSARTFVVTAVDLKKKDDADPAVIKRAARLATELRMDK
jgi:hypothetical protein